MIKCHIVDVRNITPLRTHNFSLAQDALSTMLLYGTCIPWAKPLNDQGPTSQQQEEEVEAAIVEVLGQPVAAQVVGEV